MKVVFGFGKGLFELRTPKAFAKSAQGNTLGKSWCLEEPTLKGLNRFVVAIEPFQGSFP
jgi:hypothetical protein